MRYYLNKANIILQQLQMLVELKQKFKADWIDQEVENKLEELQEVKQQIIERVEYEL